jgi:dephospho-CoA kinase
VVVQADIQTRIDRMVELRNMSRQEAESRVRAQASDEDRLTLADIVIDSNGTMTDTLRQVDDLWASLSSRTAERVSERLPKLE